MANQSPIFHPLDLNAVWAGKFHNEICACTHKLSRHRNPRCEVPGLVMTDECMDCNECRGFRVLRENPSAVSPAAAPPAPPSLIARRAALDSRPLHHRPFSLGPGGAAAVFTRAVEKALVDELSDQLRFGQDLTRENEIARWAADIIAAFKE